MKLFKGFRDFGTMTSDEKKELHLAAAAFIFFSLAAALSMRNFIWLNNTSSSEMVAVSETPARQESKPDAVIGSIRAKYDAYVRMRTYGSQLVTLAEAVGRYPVEDPSARLASAAPLIPPPIKYKAQDFPPSMEVKAIVILDGDAAAVLNIQGERPGQVARAGYTFGGGKGRITGIDAGGVNWKWANKKQRTVL
jgi:hypothetical protein